MASLSDYRHWFARFHRKSKVVSKGHLYKFKVGGRRRTLPALGFG